MRTLIVANVLDRWLGGEPTEQEKQDQGAADRLRPVQIARVVLWSASAALPVVDIKSDHPEVSWSAAATLATATTVTIWEWRLKQTRQAVVAVRRGGGYRVAW